MVIVGKTGEYPFVGFILSSKTHPDRRMEARAYGDKTKVYVLPQIGHEKDNVDYPEVDNYACISAEKISPIIESQKCITNACEESFLRRLQKSVIVGFNGHMCKRCMANIRDGMRPEIAMDSTLFEFRGVPGDARVGGIVYRDGEREFGILGINDSDRLEKRIKAYQLENNLGVYTCIKNTNLDNFVEIPNVTCPEELANYLCSGMILGLEKVISSGVTILRGGNFYTGVCNLPKSL